MKNMCVNLCRTFLVTAFIAMSGLSWADSILGLNVDDPTWCMGQNDLGQCVTFLGSKTACDSIEPCTNDHIQRYVAPVFKRDLVYCYGMNDLDQCKLFLGTKESCANVTPCNFGIQFLK